MAVLKLISGRVSLIPSCSPKTGRVLLTFLLRTRRRRRRRAGLIKNRRVQPIRLGVKLRVRAGQTVIRLLFASRGLKGRVPLVKLVARTFVRLRFRQRWVTPLPLSVQLGMIVVRFIILTLTLRLEKPLLFRGLKSRPRLLISRVLRKIILTLVFRRLSLTPSRFVNQPRWVLQSVVRP